MTNRKRKRKRELPISSDLLLACISYLDYEEEAYKLHLLSRYHSKTFPCSKIRKVCDILVLDEYEITSKNLLFRRIYNGYRFIRHIEYYSNQQKKLEGVSRIKEGNSELEYSWWYENGTKEKKIIFINNTIHLEKSWYENGKRSEELNYNQYGRLHGRVVTYHKNGNLKFEAYYRNGEAEGTETWWDIHGQQILC
jgi:hypothetical protein